MTKLALDTPSFFEDFIGPFPDVLWAPEFLSAEDHARLLDFCLNGITWKTEVLNFGGRDVPVPRELAWFGEVPYTYSGLKHTPTPMPAPLAAVKTAIEAYLASEGITQEFNSVLLNHYRNGDDSIGMHADDESQLRSQPVIASISLGSPRTFVFEQKGTRLKHKNPLPGGSLLVMKGTCQDAWRHGIPKEPGSGPRVNLTFRKTYP